MKKRIVTSFAVVAMSLSLISSSVFATGAQEEASPLIYQHEGKEYVELPIEAGPAPENAVTQSFEEGSAEKNQVFDDRKNVQEYMIANYSEIYSGAYTDENGDNVILVTETSDTLDKKVKEKIKNPNKIKFKKVKYSKKQLQSSKERISSMALSLGLEAVGVSGKKNKVNIYISNETYNNSKQEVLKYINEDMVNWVIGDLSINEKAYNLYPGERIERNITGGEYRCSLGFNGRANLKDVGVTAGHCGNGTWYDKSDGTASIGSMSNANNNSTTSYDGGYVTYVSGINPSVYLSGNSLTIGTTDYAGYYREVGDFVRVHATSGGGASFGPVEVLDNSFDLTGGTKDLVVTELSGAIGGDSGGLVYSIANNGTKNYARVEGVYKGSLADQNGNEIYDIFSKYSHTYNGLGMSGVYTDTSF